MKIQLVLNTPPGGWARYGKSTISRADFAYAISTAFKRAVDRGNISAHAGMTVIDLVGLKAAGLIPPGQINRVISSCDDVMREAERRLGQYGIKVAAAGTLTRETAVRIIGDVVTTA